MKKQQNQFGKLTQVIFTFLILVCITTPLQAQDGDAYEDEYAALLSRMVEKGCSTVNDNDFLGPVAYWQKLWDRVKPTNTWDQMMTNVELKEAERTESNGNTAMTNVLLTRSDRVAWIAFPGVGEDDDANLKSGTINIFPRWGEDDPYMDVQKFFFDEYTGLKTPITNWMDTHKDDFDKVIVTGHSKGGALSQYFLADFLDLYPDKIFHFIAFGSPNGGNENFINHWANKSNLVRAKFYTTWGWYAKFASSSRISDVITYEAIDPDRISNSFFYPIFSGIDYYYPRGLARRVDKYFTDYSDKLIRQSLKVDGSQWTQYAVWEEYAVVIHDDSRYLTGLKDAFNTRVLESIKPNDISSPSGTIRLASNTSKCLDNYAYRTVDGNNIQVYSCKTSNADAQTWKFQGSQIKLTSNPAYCLDVVGARASAGTNVQLSACRWDLNAKSQQWIYDGRTGFFRYMDDPNYCLAVSGTNVQLSACSEGNDNQQWEIDGTFTNKLVTTGKTSILKLASDPKLCIYSEEGRTQNYSSFSVQTYDTNIDQGLIFNADGSISIAKRTDRCLDLDSGKTDNNTAIQVVPCTGYGSQRWYYDGFNNALRSGADYQKCIKGGNNGEPLRLWECTNSKSQQFVIAQDFKIHLAKDDNKCMDMAGTEATDNANIQVYDCKGSTDSQSQYFTFDGSRIIMQDYPGYCLDLANGNTANGTNVRLLECNDSDDQEWIYDTTDTGTIRPKSNSSKCLRIMNGSTANENNIQLWDCTGAIAQKFVIK